MRSPCNVLQSAAAYHEFVFKNSRKAVKFMAGFFTDRKGSPYG